MKKNILCVLLLFICIHLHGQMKWNAAYQTYINQYKDLAIEEMMHYNIPASITLAQGLLESRAGQSDLTIRGNNHFGIKCHGWSGATIYHDDDEQQECFRAYKDAYESFEDHSKFLANQQRYSSLFKLSRTDYAGWAYGLKTCGYATNLHYSDKLIEIIQLYRLNQYDIASGYDKFMARHSAVDKPVMNGAILHPIYIYNDNYYLKARTGDTFKSIGKEVDISYRKLAKYNERDRNDVLSEGDIVYLKKKRIKALKTYRGKPHTVQSGESMYSIAQKYGIRLKSLYKKNNLSPDFQIQTGCQLRVY